MSIWGRVIGGAAGFALGGPIGAILGVMAGGAFDRRSKSKSSFNFNRINNNQKQQIFTLSFIILAAKLAKSDGIVSDDEIRAFKEKFKVPKSEIPKVAKIFNEAKKDTYGYKQIANQVGDLFSANKILLEELLNNLFYIAASDGKVSISEIDFLRSISKSFKFSEKDFQRIFQSNLKNSESDSNSSVNDYSSYGTILTFKSSLLRNKSESSLILSLDNNYKSILEEQNELIRVSKLNTLSLFNKYINSDVNVIAANKEYNASKLALNGVKKEEEFGLRTLLDVLDIQVDLMNSEVRLLKSKSDQLLNKYKLLIDIGKYNF